jgi:hypothetical protein
MNEELDLIAEEPQALTGLWAEQMPESNAAGHCLGSVGTAATAGTAGTCVGCASTGGTAGSS